MPYLHDDVHHGNKAAIKIERGPPGLEERAAVAEHVPVKTQVQDTKAVVARA